MTVDLASPTPTTITTPAPHEDSFKRAVEVAVVTFHSLCIAIFTLLFLSLSTIPLLWPLVIPYAISLYFFQGHSSGNLPLRSNALRSSRIWDFFASYFPAALHRSSPLAPDRKYIFGYHPHGVIAHGAFVAFCTEALGFSRLFPGITNTLLTLDANFRIPFYREYALALGLADVSSRSCQNLLSKGGPRGDGTGRAITIVVGGARESLVAAPKTLRLMIKDRKGFVRLALRTGAHLVPVLALGENDLYTLVNSDNHPMFQKLQLLIRKATGWTLPLFYGQGFRSKDRGLLAYRTPINIVVGRPIEVGVAVEVPDREEIERVHAMYVEELERMWSEWQAKLPAADGVKLEIL